MLALGLLMAFTNSYVNLTQTYPKYFDARFVDDFVVDPLCGDFGGLPDAIEERNTHRDGPDVQMLAADHPIRFQNFADRDHSVTRYTLCMVRKIASV